MGAMKKSTRRGKIRQSKVRSKITDHSSSCISSPIFPPPVSTFSSPLLSTTVAPKMVFEQSIAQKLLASLRAFPFLYRVGEVGPAGYFRVREVYIFRSVLSSGRSFWCIPPPPPIIPGSDILSTVAIIILLPNY